MDMPDTTQSDGSNVQDGLGALVIGLADVIRLTMQSQAIARLQAGDLSEADSKRLSIALFQLSIEMRDIKSKFGLDPDEDITLSLGEVNGHSIDVQSILDNLLHKGVLLKAELQLELANVNLGDLSLSLGLAKPKLQKT